MNAYPPMVKAAIERPYEFRFGDYISNGFKIIQNNLGLFIVFALVFFTAMVICQVIPGIGPLAGSLIVSPCLTAGFYLAAKKSDEGKSFEFNEFFRGFDFLGPLIVLALIQTAVIIAAMLPLIIGAFATIGFSAFEDGGDPEFSPIYLLIGLLFMLPIFYLLISWVFAPFLVIFHKMEAWPAMEASRKIVAQNWFIYLGFAMVTGILASAGLLALGVGLLFTIPASMAMTFSAFRDIVGIPGDEGDDTIEHFLVD